MNTATETQTERTTKRADSNRTREARERTIAHRCARHAKRGQAHTRSGRRAADRD